MFKIIGAGLIHLYTALGGVLAFFTLVEISKKSYPQAFFLMWVSFLIDGTDGWLARRLKVKEVMPYVDGFILDLVIDFLTYVFVPLYLLWHAGLLPAPAMLWATLILLAGFYDFANSHPLRPMGLYRGLPAMWNCYCFYVYYLRPNAITQSIFISLLFILTFVPVGYIVINRLPYLKKLTISILVAWLGLYLFIVRDLLPSRDVWLKISLVWPAYYIVSSWYVFSLHRRGKLQIEESLNRSAVPEGGMQ